MQQANQYQLQHLESVHNLMNALYDTIGAMPYKFDRQLFRNNPTVRQELLNAASRVRQLAGDLGAVQDSAPEE